ncbi:3'-5' exonuclease [Salsuginibacillus halophilus]
MFWKKRQLPYETYRDQPLNTPLADLRFTVFDTEATGFAVGGHDRLIEIGAVHIEGFNVTDRTFQTFVDPGRDIPARITELTGITEKDVAGAPDALEAIDQFHAFAADNDNTAWAAHYMAFDMLVLKKELQRHKHSFREPLAIDTLDLIGCIAPSWDMRDLQHYALNFGTNIYDRHSALGDALTTAHLFVELLRYLEARGKTTLGDILDAVRTEGSTKALQ